MTELEMARTRPRDARVTIVAFALIALMAIGSALMWIGMPFALVWLASHLQHGTNPTFGPYLVIIFGLPISMVVIGRALAGLDRRYARVTGQDEAGPRTHVPWLKSMRGERDSGQRRTVLDVVMITSVLIAGTLFLAWFLFIAGSSLPS